MDKRRDLYAIIVAAGAGTRMKSGVPKQFMEIRGMPVLMHTIRAFAAADKNIRIVVVVPPLRDAFWREMCRRYGFTVPHTVAEGGRTRFQSVKKGLAMLPDEGLVAVHDGARPLPSRETITGCFREAAIHRSAVPVMPVNDSMREVTGKSSKMLHREALRMVQTPQVFDIALLKKAYEQEYTPLFTDDASVFEKAGHAIHLTKGNLENIKITNPIDLYIAEMLIARNENQNRATP